jgi:serine/threonine-protein kinase RsbW
VSVEPISVQTSVDPTCITLTFPVGPEHIRLARLVASGLVAQLDYGLDDLEDLRIAVDELCALVVAHARPDTMIEVAFEVRGDEVIVRAVAPAALQAEIEIDELSRLILLAAADAHELLRQDGAVIGRLRKRPAGADG